ncbi:hypothetical protein [Flammeovirga sp. SubArs3]|uniref:hypothetical protein n=1 Tax=Flammeovirga sp. SubArs3 TaxID=2995316 RepID=UPI00248AD56C|nr:hypothetical protein [Flammeovirga sp. SubArs3]
MGFLTELDNVLHNNFKFQQIIEKGITFSLSTSSNTSIFKYDVNNQGDIFPFFKLTAGVRKQADAIIFLETKSGRPYILISEMKDGDRPNEAKKQYLASKLFAEYIISTINRVYKKNYAPVIRGVCVGTNLSKTPQRKTTTTKFKFDNDGWCIKPKKWNSSKILVDKMLSSS